MGYLDESSAADSRHWTFERPTEGAERLRNVRNAEAEREQLLLRERLARADAERATRLRDDMLALVVHDLRNPVNTIAMTAELMRETEMDADARRHHLEVIERAALGMAALITDLLDVSTLDSGEFTIESAVLDLPLLIRHTLEDFQTQAKLSGVTLLADVADDLPPVRGDAGRLSRVLGNLVNNALKFSPAAGRVILRVARRRGGVEIAVEDSGPGMEADVQLHVFDRFWHADRQGRAGSGLGLYICKGIVEAHGGRIDVESAPGTGSIFRITLPA